MPRTSAAMRATPRHISATTPPLGLSACFGVCAASLSAAASLSKAACSWSCTRTPVPGPVSIPNSIRIVSLSLTESAPPPSRFIGRALAPAPGKWGGQPSKWVPAKKQRKGW